MNNRGSRRNIGYYVSISGICETLLDYIKEVDAYKNWSYKIQIYIEHHK